MARTKQKVVKKPVRQPTPPSTQGGTVIADTNLVNDARRESSQASDDFVNARNATALPPGVTYRALFVGIQNTLQTNLNHRDLIAEIEKGKAIINDTEALKQAHVNYQKIKDYQGRGTELQKKLGDTVIEAAEKIPGLTTRLHNVLTTKLSEELSTFKKDYGSLTRQLRDIIENNKQLTKDLETYKSENRDLMQQLEDEKNKHAREISDLEHKMNLMQARLNDESKITTREIDLSTQVKDLEKDLANADERLELAKTTPSIQSLTRKLQEEGLLNAFNADRMITTLDADTVSLSMMYRLLGLQWIATKKAEKELDASNSLIEAEAGKVKDVQEQISRIRASEKETRDDKAMYHEILTRLLCSRGMEYVIFERGVSAYPAWKRIAFAMIGNFTVQTKIREFLNGVVRIITDLEKKQQHINGENDRIEETTKTLQEGFDKQKKESEQEYTKIDELRVKATKELTATKKTAKDMGDKLFKAQEEAKKHIGNDKLIAELQAKNMEQELKLAKMEAFERDAAKIDGLDLKMNEQREARTIAEHELTMLRAELQTTKESLDRITSEKQAVDGSLRALQGGETSRDELLTSLNNQTNDLKESKQRIEQELADIRKLHSTCQTEKARLEGTNESIITQLGEQKAEVKRLEDFQWKYDASSRQVDELQSSKASEVERLNSEIAGLTQSLNKANNDANLKSEEVNSWVETIFKHLLNQDPTEYEGAMEKFLLVEAYETKKELVRSSAAVITLQEASPAEDSMLILLRVFYDCVVRERSISLDTVNLFLHNLPTDQEDLKFAVALLHEGLLAKEGPTTDFLGDIAFHQLFRFVQDRYPHSKLTSRHARTLMSSALVNPRDMKHELDRANLKFKTDDYEFIVDQPGLLVRSQDNVYVLGENDFAFEDRGMTWVIMFNLGRRTITAVFSATNRSARKCIQKMPGVSDKMTKGNLHFVRYE